MHIDPILPLIVELTLAAVIIGIILKRLGQPHVVGYLVLGMLFGPHGMSLVSDPAVVGHLGSLGVVLLLFFIGMEVSPKRLAANWKIAVVGTLMQILVTVIVVWLFGALLDWPLARSILLGFAISLSSTAVVLKLLQDWDELDTKVGQDVLGILLVQDLAVVPMLILIGVLGGDRTSGTQLILQVVGGIAITGLAAWVAIRDQIHLPFVRLLGTDREMQLFVALLICFGLGYATGLLGLSTALGAFVAGMVVASARETHWVHHSLDSYRILFIALFFVSVGMLVDLDFVRAHWPKLLGLVALVLVGNTILNALIVRVLGSSWRESMYTGAVLSQVGEFSFVLAAVGLQASIITPFGHQMTIALISLSLLLSPAWIAVTKRVVRVEPSATSQPGPE